MVQGADILLNKLFYRLFPLPFPEGDLSVSGHSNRLFLDRCWFLTSHLDMEEGGNWSSESSCRPTTLLPWADSGQMWGSSRLVNTELRHGYTHCYKDWGLCSAVTGTGQGPCRDHFPGGLLPSQGGSLMYPLLIQSTNAASASSS